MNRDRPPGGQPGRAHPVNHVAAGYAARPRLTCGILGICGYHRSRRRLQHHCHPGRRLALRGGPGRDALVPGPRRAAGAADHLRAASRQPRRCPVTLAASASSGLPVTFTSATPAVCTVSGATVTTLAPGNCSITATQGGSASYAAAPGVTRLFGVAAGHQPQKITFWPPPDTRVGHPIVLTASSSSGLAVAFSSGTPAVCTVSGATVTTVAAGTCSITASQGGSTTYMAALDAARSFRVNPAPPKLPGALIGALAAAALAAAAGVLAWRRRRLGLHRRPPATPGPSVRAEPSPGPPGSASVRATGATVAHTVRIRSDPGAGTITIKETRHDTSSAAGTPSDRP